MILRSLLLMLMIVAFLPWGAFSAKFGVSDDSNGQTSQAVAASEVSHADAPAVSDRAKGCKGPALPGSPCGPSVIAVPPVGQVGINPSITKAVFHWRDDRFEAADRPAVLDPPILA